MPRIPAEDSQSGETTDTTDDQSDQEDYLDRGTPEDIQDDPAPDPDPTPEPEQPTRGGGTATEPEPEPEPTPEPDQPARGGDRDSGDGMGSGGTGDVGETEPEPDPTDQPARGADPGSGDGMGSGTPEAEPEPTPEPTQPARGREETRTGDETVREELERQEQEFTISPEELQETRTLDVGSEEAARQAAADLRERERVEEVAVRGGELQILLEPTRQDIASELEGQPGTEQVFIRGDEQQGDVTAVVGPTEEQIERAELAASEEMDEAIGAGAREVSAAREAVQRERTREEFGDVAVTIPETLEVAGEYDGPTGETAPPGARGGRMADREVDIPGGGERLENVLTDLSADYQQAVERRTAEGTFLGESATAEALEAAGYEGTGERVEDIGRDFLRGVGVLGDVPGTAATVKEGAEFAGYAGQEIAEGELEALTEQTATATTTRAQALADYAQESPGELAGITAGSLVGSAAIMGGAARVSSTAGRATRYAIQPGEELAGTAGFRATRALRGEGTAQRLFPNQEPLIFSEEAAIRAGSELADRIRSTRQALTGEVELEGTARQQELIELARPEGPTGRLTETGEVETDPVPAGPSEPLGSPTEDIVTASLEGGGGFEVGRLETETAAEAETQRQGVTDQMREMAGEATAREQLSQAADEFGVRMEDFFADERGQASLVGGSSRGVTESEVERTEERVTPNLYQQAISRQVETEYESLQDTIESPEYRFGGRGPESRVRRATETEVETETETELDGRTRTELRLEPFTGLDVTPETDVDVRPDVGPATRPDVRGDVDVAEIARPDIEQELETEQEVTTDTAVDIETEFGPIETEIEPRPETRTPREAETEAEPPEEEQPRDERGPLDVQALEEEFATGIASVEDLLEGR